MEFAEEVATRRLKSKNVPFKPFVVGAVIDLGLCLDLMSSNGTQVVKESYLSFRDIMESAGSPMPVNSGGDDLWFRNLDRAVIEYLHASRSDRNETEIETVRALFPEEKPLYDGAGFRAKTHIQICVRKAANIKGVFRVPKHHFSSK